MAEQSISLDSGLVTDGLALSGRRSASALRRAHNVLLSRPGEIVGRPGFGATDLLAEAPSDPDGRVRHLFSWRHVSLEKRVVVYDDPDRGGTNNPAIMLGRSDSGTPVINAKDFEDLSLQLADTGPSTRSYWGVFAAVHRHVLYLTGRRSMLRWTHPSASTAEAVLAIQRYDQGVSVVTGQPGAKPFEASTGYAYRYVWVQDRAIESGEDAEPYQVYSEPSHRILVAPGATGNTRLTLPVRGDRLRVYRTKGVTAGTGIPLDEYLLVEEVLASGATITWTDYVADEDLGEPLYTNAGQQSATQENGAPPKARAVALWQDRVWYANVDEPARVEASVLDVGGHWDTNTQPVNTTGLQVRRLLVNTSVGSANVTITSGGTGTGTGSDFIDANGLDPWIAFTMDPTDLTFSPFFPRSRVIAASGSTLTMNQPATNNQSNVVAYVGDVVQLTITDPDKDGTNTSIDEADRRVLCYCNDGTPLAGANADEVALGISSAVDIAGGGTDGRLSTTRRLAKALQDGLDANALRLRVEPPVEGSTAVSAEVLSAVLRIETLEGGAAIQLTSSRPTALRPDTAPATAETYGRDLVSNRVYFSKRRLPEAVPRLNFVDVGDGGEAILSVVSLGEVLLVFTDRRIYRLRGIPGSSLRVDEVSQDARLLAPRLTAGLGNICYAWTSQGILQIGQSGVIGNVGAPIDDKLRSVAVAALGDSRLPDPSVYYAVAHPLRRIVAFAYSTDLTDDHPVEWLVFHEATQRWSTWGRTDLAAAAFGDRGWITSASNEFALRQERTGEERPGTDLEIDISASATLSGDMVDVPSSALGVHTPQIGDVIHFQAGGASDYRRIVQVLDVQPPLVPVPIYQIRVDSTPTLSVVKSWHQAYESELLWQPLQLAGVRAARWRELWAYLLGGSSSTPTWPLQIGGAAHDDTAPTYVSADVAYSSPDTYARPIRAGLPREIIASPVWYPAIRVKTAEVFWRLGRLGVVFDPSSIRGVR